jgi:hypothetical protein
MSMLEDFIARNLAGNAPSVTRASSYAPPRANQRRGVFGAPMADDALGTIIPYNPGIQGQQPGGMSADPRINAINAMPNDVNRQLAANEAAKKPSFFGQGGAGRAIVGNLGDALSQIGGGQATYAPAMRERARQLAEAQRQQAEWQRQDGQRAEDRQWQVEDRDYKAQAPQYFMSGNDRVQYNPATGEATTVYDAPEEYQTYAQTLGLKPEDDGYDQAVQDYVLRGNGPTALQGRQALEGERQSNRMQLRATPTYANLHPRAPAPRSGSGGRGQTMAGVIAPILAKTAQGHPLTAGEQQAFEMWRRRGGSGGAGRGGGGGGGGAPSPRSNPASMVPGTSAMPVTVASPDQAKVLPKGTWFTVNGKTYQRH